MSILEWRQQEVLAEIAGKVVQGMDDACAFAAEQARSKAPKKSGFLKENIDHEVKARGLTVTGYVGVKHAAFYGYFHELGTSKMAAHPFLRPAVLENADEIVRRVAGGGK